MLKHLLVVVFLICACVCGVHTRGLWMFARLRPQFVEHLRERRHSCLLLNFTQGICSLTLSVKVIQPYVPVARFSTPHSPVLRLLLLLLLPVVVVVSRVDRLWLTLANRGAPPTPPPPRGEVALLPGRPPLFRPPFATPPPWVRPPPFAARPLAGRGRPPVFGAPLVRPFERRLPMLVVLMISSKLISILSPILDLWKKNFTARL